MFEKIFHKHVYSYLEYYKLLIPNNSSFRKIHSTLTSLLGTCDSLYQAYDSNLSSRIVFLDISKAFARVDHTCLIFKLQQIGIVGSLLSLLSFYLFRRSGRTRSDFKYTNCGVPQGSVLGLLLFLIYVNDTATNIKASILSLQMTPPCFIQISVLSTCTVCLLKISARCTIGLSFGIFLSISQNCGHDHT